MFTGLVQDRGPVRSAEPGPDGAGLRLVVETRLAPELAPGDSIAVSGVCLTAAEVGGGAFAADVMPETARRSSLGALGPGAEVNLELPLRAGDRLGGHFVQGHVDAVGELESVADEGAARRVRIAAPGELLRYVVEKGSIAVDGVSLTVVAVDTDGLTVALVPETLSRTTLGRAAPGRLVNLEADVLAKHVERLLGAAEVRA
jgi:riboflavin synthase